MVLQGYKLLIKGERHNDPALNRQCLWFKGSWPDHILSSQADFLSRAKPGALLFKPSQATKAARRPRTNEAPAGI